MVDLLVAVAQLVVERMGIGRLRKRLIALNLLEMATEESNR